MWPKIISLPEFSKITWQIFLTLLELSHYIRTNQMENIFQLSIKSFLQKGSINLSLIWKCNLWYSFPVEPCKVRFYLFTVALNAYMWQHFYSFLKKSTKFKLVVYKTFPIKKTLSKRKYWFTKLTYCPWIKSALSADLINFNF